MPSYVTLTIDDLDAELKKEQQLLANFADFTARRTRCYQDVLAEYQESLAQSDDIFVRADNIDTPTALGTEKVNTSTGDVYSVALPSDARRIAGNNIMVELAASATFVNVPRMSWDTIIASGGSQTPYAFWEKNGKLLIYVKDTGAFVNTASVVFTYYRKLDATVTTGTALDIKPQDFSQIVSDTLTLIKD